MAVSAGGAVLQVTPQLVKTFSKDLVNQMAGPATRSATKAGTDAGRTFGKQFSAQSSQLVGRSADKEGEKHGRRFGTRFSGGIRAGVGPVKGFFRGFGPALGIAFGATALIAGIKDVTNEARDAAAVGRLTTAVLKSTGGVANVSAKQVANLAQALSEKVGVDDDLIQSGQNLLLTFTGIRNEAGKGNDIFNQASSAVLDLTASMNKGQITATGLKASTIQVGKALNDPIKGMTALTRVGVTFNDQQKKQIKTLVESGDKLGAQKIILAELRKEFGGSAAASADAGKRFGVFVGNLKEKIGGILLPALNSVLGFLVDTLPKAFGVIGRVFQPLVGWFQKASQSSGVLGKAFASISASVRPAVQAFTEALLPGLRSLQHVVQAQVFPALKVLAAVIGVALFAALKYVLPLLLRIAGPVLGFFFKQTAQTIQWISNLIRWIGRVGAWLARWITGTKTTGQAIQELGRRVGVFASNMAKQWAGITRSVGNALGFLRRTTVTVLSFMIRLWLRWAGSILDAAAHAMGWVPGIGGKLRGAQAKFHEFARSVNASLDRIRNKHIDVSATARVKLDKSTRAAITNSMAALRERPRAAGGPINGPGTGTSDSIRAAGPGGTSYRLSDGEHVWTAKEVANAGGHGAMERMREQFRARGGPVLSVAGSTKGSFRDLERWYRDVLAGTRQGSQKVIDALASLLGRRMTQVAKKAAALGGGKAGIKAFIRAVDSHPYVWGGVGPGGYDCSGLVGEVYARHTGKRSYRRYFTTSSIGGMGFPRGPGGTLQIGVTPGHHMAGRYGGLGFEAASTRTGIKIGAAARRPESFPVMYHLARGGRVEAAKQLASLGVEVGGDPGGMWLRKNKSLGIFDRGGLLMPGQLGYNGTSQPERVLPPGQSLGIDYDKLGQAVARAMATQRFVASMNPNEARQSIKEAQRQGGVPRDKLLR